MKITGLSAQQTNPNRINVFVDDKYRFSLEISQIASLGVRVGDEYSESELEQLEQESQFGKLYARALEYCLMRPHSAKEVRDYLWRKTQTTRYRSRRTGEIKERAGVSQALADRVLDRLVEKRYVDDEAFTRYWVENRNLTKGSSLQKLRAELRTKGVSPEIINQHIDDSARNDQDELRKIIAKKQNRYPDRAKFIQYLARQGFKYDDIMSMLDESS